MGIFDNIFRKRTTVNRLPEPEKTKAKVEEGIFAGVKDKKKKKMEVQIGLFENILGDANDLYRVDKNNTDEGMFKETTPDKQPLPGDIGKLKIVEGTFADVFAQNANRKPQGPPRPPEETGILPTSVFPTSTEESQQPKEIYNPAKIKKERTTTPMTGSGFFMGGIPDIGGFKAKRRAAGFKPVSNAKADEIISEQDKHYAKAEAERVRKSGIPLDYKGETLRKESLTDWMPYFSSAIEVVEDTDFIKAQNFLSKYKKPEREDYSNINDYLNARDEHLKHVNYKKDYTSNVAREANRTTGGKAIFAIKNAIPYVIEFVATGGGAAVGKGLTNKLIRKGGKKLLRKEIQEEIFEKSAKTALLEGLEAKGKRAGVKAFTKQLGIQAPGTAVGALTQTVFNPLRVAVNALDAATTVDEKGEVTIGDPKVVEGFFVTAIDMFSERTGQAALALPSAAIKGALGKTVAITPGLSKLVGKMDKFFFKWKLKNPNGTGKAFANALRKAGINNIFEESVEERIGGAITAAAGFTDSNKGFIGRTLEGSIPHSLDDVLVELAAVSVPGLIFASAGGMGGIVPKKPSYTTRLNEETTTEDIDKAQQLIKEGWEESGFKVNSKYNKEDNSIRTVVTGMTNEGVEDLEQKAKDKGVTIQEYVKEKQEAPAAPEVIEEAVLETTEEAVTEEVVEEEVSPVGTIELAKSNLDTARENINVDLPEGPINKDFLNEETIPQLIDRTDLVIDDIKKDDVQGNKTEVIDTLTRDNQALSNIKQLVDQTPAINYTSTLKDSIRVMLGEGGEPVSDETVKEVFQQIKEETSSEGDPFVGLVQSILDRYNSTFTNTDMTEEQKDDAILNANLQDVANSAQEKVNEGLLENSMQDIVSSVENTRGLVPLSVQKEIDDLTENLISGPKNVEFVRTFIDDYQALLDKATAPEPTVDFPLTLDDVIEEPEVEDVVEKEEPVVTEPEETLESKINKLDKSLEKGSELSIRNNTGEQLDTNIQSTEGVLNRESITQENMESIRDTIEDADNLLNNRRSERTSRRNVDIIEKMNDALQSESVTTETKVKDLPRLGFNDLFNAINNRNLGHKDPVQIRNIPNMTMADVVDRVYTAQQGLLANERLIEVGEKLADVTDESPEELDERITSEIGPRSVNLNKFERLVEYQKALVNKLKRHYRPDVIDNVISPHLVDSLQSISSLMKKTFPKTGDKTISTNAQVKLIMQNKDVLFDSILNIATLSANRVAGTVGSKTVTVEDLENQIKVLDRGPVNEQMIPKDKLGIAAKPWNALTRFFGGALTTQSVKPEYLARTLGGRDFRGPIYNILGMGFTDGRATANDVIMDVTNDFTKQMKKYNISERDIKNISDAIGHDLSVTDVGTAAINKFVKLQLMRGEKITFESGRSVRLSLAEILDLHMASLQEEGEAHLKNFGFKKYPTSSIGFVAGLKRTAGLKPVTIPPLSVADIQMLEDMVEGNKTTKSLKKIFRSISDSTLKPRINKVSMGIDGFEVAKEPNYWHLEVFTNDKIATQPVNINIFERQGRLIPRTGGDGALIVRDSVVRFFAESNAIADYIGLAIPIRQASAITSLQSFQDLIDKNKYDKELKAFVTIMNDAARSGSYSTSEHILKYIRNVGVSAILVGNPGVILMQSASTMNYGTVYDREAFSYQSKYNPLRWIQKIPVARSVLGGVQTAGRVTKNMAIVPLRIGGKVTSSVADTIGLKSIPYTGAIKTFFSNIVDKTVNKTINKNLTEMTKYSSTFFVRDRVGNINMELAEQSAKSLKGQLTGKRKGFDKASGGLRTADGQALSNGWGMAKNEVKHVMNNGILKLSNPAAIDFWESMDEYGYIKDKDGNQIKIEDVKIGSDAYWDFVDLRSHYAWNSTQPNYDNTNKTQNTSGNTAAVSIMYPFRSYWNTVVSMVQDTFGRARYDARKTTKYKNVQPLVNKIKNFILIASSIMITSAFKDMFNQVLRELKDPDDIEEMKTIVNSLTSIFALVPIIGNILQPLANKGIDTFLLPEDKKIDAKLRREIAGVPAFGVVNKAWNKSVKLGTETPEKTFEYLYDWIDIFFLFNGVDLKDAEKILKRQGFLDGDKTPSKSKGGRSSRGSGSGRSSRRTSGGGRSSRSSKGGRSSRSSKSQGRTSRRK